MDYIECSADGCTRPERQSGECATHRNQTLYGLAARVENRSANQACSVSHCTRQANSRAAGAMCDSHYQLSVRQIDPESKILSKLLTACWVPDCRRDAVTHSLCKSHEVAAKRGRLAVPELLGVKVNPPCTFDGCETPQSAKALCHGHYCQSREGKNLSPLRDYGEYTNAARCAVPTCKKPAIAKELCMSHGGKMKKYSLTLPALVEIAAIGVCQNPGCDTSIRLHIDHDHATGAVRGVLCNGCNTSLGFLKEDHGRIMGLVSYLGSNLSTIREAA